MPFPGASAADTAKIDRCVARMRKRTNERTGKSFTKSEAIAVCRASIKKKERDEMTGKAKRKRRKLEHQELQLQDAQDDIEAATVENKVLGADDVELAPELDDKHFSEMVEVVSVGPQSFGELDEHREAQERAFEVRKAVWDTEDLLGNIMRDPESSPEEKGQRISKVGSELPSRVKAALQEEKEFNFDQAQAEVLARQAKDLGIKDISLIDRIAQKAGWTQPLKDLPDTAFALVLERDGEVVRDFPIHKKVYVRNSLLKAAKALGHGGVEAEDAIAALPNIRAAAKELGLGEVAKEPNGILVSKNFDKKMMEEFPFRFVGWASNNFIDREGEIITEEAHKEYVDWLWSSAFGKKEAFAPEFLSWHTPGTGRKSRVDWADYINGFVIVSGPLSTKEAKGLMDAQKKQAIGMSHTYWVLQKKDNVISKYRSIEVSDLPLAHAANPWTGIAMIEKEVKAIMSEKSAYLKEMVGEEFYKELVESTKENQALLRELGIDEKEVDAAQEEANSKDEKPSEKNESDEPTVEGEKKELSMEQTAFMEVMSQAVSKSLGLDALSKWVEGVDETLIELKELAENRQKSDDEKVADIFEAPASKAFAWQKQAPTQSKENIVEEDDELMGHLPPGAKNVDHWFSDASGAPALSPAEAKVN